MNPSTTKKSKKGTQEIPVPKILSSKNTEIDKQKLKDPNTEQTAKEIKSNKNIKKSNIVFNNLILNNKNVNKTETKNKIKKSCNSQTQLGNINDEINKNEKNSKDKIIIEKTGNEKIFRNSLTNKITRKISLKHNVKEYDTFNNKDSLSYDNDNSIENIKKSNNMNIKTDLNSFSISSELDINNKPLNS